MGSSPVIGIRECIFLGYSSWSKMETQLGSVARSDDVVGYSGSKTFVFTLVSNSCIISYKLNNLLLC